MPQLYIPFLILATGTGIVPILAVQILNLQALSPQALLSGITNNLLVLNNEDILAKVDQDLFNALQSSLSSSDILVEFRGTHNVINGFDIKNFPTLSDGRRELVSRLQAFTLLNQLPVNNFLSVLGIQFRSFWIANCMVIKNAALGLVSALSTFTDVTRIRKAPVITLSPIVEPNVRELNAENSALAIQWGIMKIQADQAWAQGTTGKGVVVATIDTGVRGTHEALVGNHRADHGWFDPYTGTSVPTDENGHGTHTMGTICGQNGIGVAPDAQWISCRGCNSDSCGSLELLDCGQFMMMPTTWDGDDADFDMVPDVVSCSWGSALGNDDFYNSTIDSWTKAGILHAFAIGNSGPACRTAGSPGDQPRVFSVGSTDKNDKLSSFSSRGPATITSGVVPKTLNMIKPEIAAPGSDIYSAWFESDNDYNTISGTSMATPHVAGTIALMLSALRDPAQATNVQDIMAMDSVSNFIEQSADTDLSTGVLSCGTISAKCTYPNNQFGYGRINAFKAVEAVKAGSLPEKPSCGESNNKKQSLLSLASILGLLG